MSIKTKISKEEYQLVKDQSHVASMVLENEDFKFIQDYINNSLESIKTQLLTGVATGTNTYLTEKQTNDFQAQYRWINEFMSMIEITKNAIGELDKAIDKKMVLFKEGENGSDTVSERG
jgi:hypothetical protein